jgi:hypothetical protein
MAAAQSSLKTLKSKLADIATQAPEDVNDRKELLAAAKDVALALERPDDVIERVCFQVSRMCPNYLETLCLSS